MHSKRERRAVTSFAVVLILLALAIHACGVSWFGYANPYILLLSMIYFVLAGVVVAGLRLSYRRSDALAGHARAGEPGAG